MGLGKTVQTISLIAAILQKTGERDKDVPQLRKRRRGEDNSKRILIVMPSSVLDNWYDQSNSHIHAHSNITHTKGTRSWNVGVTFRSSRSLALLQRNRSKSLSSVQRESVRFFSLRTLCSCHLCVTHLSYHSLIVSLTHRTTHSPQ